jgi:hypothetical protein
LLHGTFSARAVQVDTAAANGIDATLRVVVGEAVLLFSGAQTGKRVKFSQLFVEGGLKDDSLLLLAGAKQFLFRGRLPRFGPLAGDKWQGRAGREDLLWRSR